MHCVREEHSAANMNLHYLENGTVMLNFIYQKELFFLPLGFALKVWLTEYISFVMKRVIHWKWVLCRMNRFSLSEFMLY